MFEKKNWCYTAIGFKKYFVDIYINSVVFTEPICMLHWISSTELVIINPNGTINQWKLKKDAQRK